MSLSNRCSAPLRTQGSIMGPGSLQGTQIGSSTGRSAFKNTSTIPNQQIVDLLDAAATLLPAGIYPQIIPRGGTTNQPSATVTPEGLSVNVQLVNGGSTLTPQSSPQLYTTFLSGLIGNSLLDKKVCGIGLYNWGIYFDQAAGRQTGRADIVSWNGWPEGVDAGPADVLSSAITQGRARADRNERVGDGKFFSDGSSGSNSNNEAFDGLRALSSAAPSVVENNKQKQTACEVQAAFNQTRTGGNPISGLALAAAHSISNNQGLQVPTELTQATSLYDSAQIISLNADIVDLLRSPVDYTTVSGIQTITSTVEQLLDTGIKNTLNSLTGKMTKSTAGIIDGNLSNVITRPIVEIANNVLGNGDLSKFTNIFNNVVGATSSASGIGRALTQLEGQIFGNARSVTGSDENQFNLFAGYSIDGLAGGRYKNLIGPIETTITDAVKDQPMAFFGTAYYDMNAMITHGLGSLTNNLHNLGSDLKSLGKLANLEDLLRIGKPGQIVQQLMLNGAEASHKIIIKRLTEINLNLSSINLPENDDRAREILASIQDSSLIADAFKVLNIQRTPAILSLIEFENPVWLFPRSRNDNRFNNLNDIALHLSILGNLNITSLEELGDLMLSMESISTDNSVTNEIQPIRLEENSIFRNNFSPSSEYSGDDDLTVADFIGTAAGYRVIESLTKSKEYIDRITSSGILDCYIKLLELMRDILNGTYGSGTVLLPVLSSTGDPSGTSVVNASNTNPVEITTNETVGYLVEDGMQVVIDNIAGMTELNGNTYYVEIVTPDLYKLYYDSSLTASVDATGYGVFVSGGDIALTNPHCNGRYKFNKTYATKNLAALAVKTAIETELDYIKNNHLNEDLLRLQSLHDEINYQLYKEQDLRKKYGIDIGFSKTGVELFGGDGSTTDFKLIGAPDPDNDPKLTVYVGGSKLTTGQFSYNSQLNVVTLVSAPSDDQSIEIIYDTGNQAVAGNIRDVWSFSSSLETFGIRTGFGKEADYIQRIITNDFHGARIKAAMIQARNKERASAARFDTNDYNRASSTFNEENINNISTFAEVTGIWADNPARASEVYLQNKVNVESREEYSAFLIKKNKNKQQKNFDELMSTVARKLIFYSSGYIAISTQLAEFYTQYRDSFKNRKFSSSDVFKITLDENYSDSGFVIGPYKQIISEILRIESVEDFIFNVELSDPAKKYLESIEIDLKSLIAMIQKIMIVNAANYLGIIEDDARSIFNIPGVGKYLVRNIANQL